MKNSTPSSMSRQRGVTLLEALIAFLILSLGMLAVARVQASLRQQSDIARQRSEAVRLAQQDIEALRAFAVVEPRAGMLSFDEIASTDRRVDSSTGYASNTRYSLSRRIDAAGSAPAKQVSVTVGWTARNGEAQQISLQSMITGTDPSLTAALALRRSSEPAVGPLARSIRIPIAAKDLGDGRSALKPVAGANVALLFDNRSGWVIGRCGGIAATIDTRSLQAADLLGCDALVGRLLSGFVRFSSSSPPDAAHANDTPLPLAINVVSSGPVTTAPACSGEAVKTVRYSAGGSLHIDNVPLAAVPASLGLGTWTESGERAFAYHCVVYPGNGLAWSGLASVAASGWQIGTAAGQHRVCRYASDLDGSGAIDANIEHPARYAAASTALAQQNYLVVGGTETCPGGSTTHIAGTSTDVFANLATVQHQP